MISRWWLQGWMLKKGDKRKRSLISYPLKDKSGIMSDFLSLYLTSFQLSTCITYITFGIKKPNVTLKKIILERWNEKMKAGDRRII